MLEFNLLPDVKMQYLRAKHTEYLVIVISFIVGAAALLIFILMFLYVDVAQKVKLDDLTSQINSSTAALKGNQNLNQILTVQNQLETLPQLESSTPKTSRLFGYLTQLVPSNATISSLSLDYSANSLTITGGADSLATINTFVDTLKYATYNDASTSTNGKQAFKQVVLSSVNINSTNVGAGGAPPATYTVTVNFDPLLFSADNITLVVPNETTTRSILNQPTLFKANPKPTTGQ